MWYYNQDHYHEHVVITADEGQTAGWFRNAVSQGPSLYGSRSSYERNLKRFSKFNPGDINRKLGETFVANTAVRMKRVVNVSQRS